MLKKKLMNSGKKVQAAKEKIQNMFELSKNNS